MKKIIISLITILIINLVSMNVVYASTSVGTKLESNNNDYLRGEKIELTLKLENLKEVRKGVNAYKATLDYDRDVFEEIIQSDFVCLNNWEEFKYNPQNGQFVLIKKTGTTKNENIVKINLKVKKDANIEKTVIKLKDITTSEGKEDININNINLTVNIVEKQISIPTNTANKVISSANNKINKNQNNIKDSFEEKEMTDKEIEENSKNSYNDRETSKEEIKIKKTNRNYFWILFLLLIITVCILYVVYKKEKNKKYFILFALGLLLCEIISTTCVYAYNIALKGELNNDSVINYADLSLLELHLIDLKELPSDKLEPADMNCDGKLTVTDLSLLVQKLEQNLDYTVDIANITAENLYPNKNANITFKFNGNVSYGSSIEKLIINGQEYKVSKDSTSDTLYSVNLNVGDTAGLKVFKITEALLDNNKKIKIDYETEVDVLKEKPTISNYNVKENINDSKLNISFDIVDIDNSLEKSYITITDATDESIIILKEKVNKGKNNIELKVEDKKEYKASIDLNYDLDSNQITNDEDHTGTEKIEKTLQLLIDYNFSISNIKTYKDNTETTTFTKGDQVKIKFESTNNTKWIPSTIKVNNSEYQVTKEDNNYTVLLDPLDSLNNQTILIEEVTLENGKKIEITNNNSININVIKREPAIKNFGSAEYLESNNLRVMFDVEDEDMAISKIYIKILDDKGVEIDNEELSRDAVDNDNRVTKYLNTIHSSKYQVQVYMDYNITGDAKDNIANKLALDEEVIALARANIVNATTDRSYINKGEEVNIIYDIQSNRNQTITKILVNSTECIATKLSDGRYQVTVPTSTEAGLYRLEATKVYYSDEETAKVSNISYVDILKEAPTIANYSQIDNTDTNEVTLKFDIIDTENSFISGKAILSLNGTSFEKIISKGTNELTFDVVPLESYTLTIKSTYDLDSNALSGKPVEDNRVVDQIIDTKEIHLIADYKLELSNIKTYNEKGPTIYFAKSEPIKISFESKNVTSYEPVKVIIKGVERELTKVGNEYHFTYESHKQPGVKRAKIEKIILSNAKEIVINENNEIAVAVLKDKPTVTNFSYKENNDASLTITFNLVDLDNSLSSAKLLVTSESGIVKEKILQAGENTYTFTPDELVYTATVKADYDLDMNILEENANNYQNVTLLENDITLGERKFEMKDIAETIVYKQTDNGVIEATNININELNNLNDYIVKVTMKDMPTFYTTINKARVEDNKLKLELDYDNVVQYNKTSKQEKLEIDYGTVKNGQVQNISLETLIKEMELNPSGTFNLERDYDASAITSSSQTYITSTFSGTLNGNGHTIYNLSKPLFNSLDSACIKNIKLKNVNLTATGNKGTIANIATNSTIKDIHIDKINFTTQADKSGGILGEATTTDIENTSIINASITTSHIRVGVIIGQLSGGNIRNCYISGNVKANYSKDGNGLGGILGTGEAGGLTTIENCISNIKFTSSTGHRLNGAIVGHVASTNVKLVKNLSLSTGKGLYATYGNPINASSSDNYEVEETTLTSNVDNQKVKRISKNDINSIFFKNTLSFSEEIWNLEDTNFDNLPTLKSGKYDLSSNEEDQEVENNTLYIPEYNRVKTINGYNKDKDNVYHNVYKLMPYYDAKYLIEDALKIQDENLNSKTIRYIIPYSNGNMLTYLTAENYNNITEIKVVFTDSTISSYNVNFKELNQNISIYQLAGTEIYYSPDSYVIENDSNIVEVLKNYISTIDYNTVLEPLTSAADARHYRDNFNEVIKGLSSQVALQLLANDKESSLTINNEVLNNKIKEDLIDSGRINKIIYGYNYFNRWYGFNIGGSNVSDLLLFKGNMFNESCTLENLTNETLIGNINVNATDGFFKSNVGKYTGSSELKYFLDYIISKIGGYSDVNDWFTQYFGSRNILAEFGVDKNPDILYRAWYQIKKNSKMILPIVTLPADCTYIISGPAHLQIGPSQLYHKDVNTAAGRAAVQKKVNDHSTLVKRHLSTLAGSFDPGKWNNYCIMVYDCTRIITGYKNSYFPGTNIVIGTSPVYTQGKVGQNYPFFKNFSEVLGLWQPGGSAAGVGNTAGFLWFIARQGLTNYDTWTHEFEHALFDKIMLFQAGTRFKYGLETLTEGNVQQNGVWSENNLVQDVGPYYFNTSFYLNKEGNATQNLSPDRIDTREKLENYFRGQQNALDLLDYIEGKAFIRLTPEQQARVATRMSQSGSWSSWGAITKAQAEQMNLTSLESLYDNRIIIRPENAWGVSVRGLRVINSLGANDYGFESVWVNRWYIGHNDNGIPDAFSAKRNYFEMLGYAGVNGYVTYGRGSTKTDLDAIQKITKSVTGTAMNWKEYKMSRYATVEENIRNNKYIDVDYMIERFYQALSSDTNRNATSRTNLRKIYYHYLKSATNDFVDDPLGTTVEVNHIKTAEELVQKINAQPYGYYVLDNDIDFSHMTTNVTKTFMGRLDGNGHKIIGNTLPIFNKIRYGYVGNIHFENTDIPKNINNAGALTYRAEMSTVEKINATNLKMNFGGRNDISLIGGTVSNVITRDCTVEKLTYHITSAEDMAKLNEDPSGIFIIDNDIDFTGKTYSEGSVVTAQFNGKINGNGHTLSNLTNASLFANFRGTAENFNIRNFSNIRPGTTESNNYVAAFAKQTFNSTVKNAKFENITLSGYNNVAVVSGMDGRDNANSIFENISIKNANVTGTGVYVSTFVGRKWGGKIANVFVHGNLNISSTENGGLVGSLQQNGAIVENVITDVSITKDHNTYNNLSSAEFNGSMIGNIYNTPIIKNSIAFGNMIGYIGNDGTELKPYKFTGALANQIITSIMNCYEIDEENGSSRVSEETAGKLNSISRSKLNKQFYKDLGFDETIWNLDNLSAKGYPELR